MSNFKFNLMNKEVLDQIRSPLIYEFNMAKNLALLSNDAAIIRRFYQIDVLKYFKDPWLMMQIENSFFRYYQQGQAYAYFGIIPMIVAGKVNLLTSSGFKFDSKDDEIDDVLEELREEASLNDLFSGGVYWESGIGDFAYRISYSPETADRPIIDIVEPHHLEINYMRGEVVSYVVKEVSEENAEYELHEIHHIGDSGYLTISYRYVFQGKYVAPNDENLLKQCERHFLGVDTTEKTLPFKDFATIVFKKNANHNQLYKGERGVPDIQGLDTIEEALTETISDLMDAIRKGGIKEYLSDALIPQDADGNDLRFNQFNKTIIFTKGGGEPGDNRELHKVTQANIQWEAYKKTIELLVSTACNKAGLSPLTLGISGLESINSSSESQDSREKTSLRTRDACLDSWEVTLKELLNKYLQVYDYIHDREILDYTDCIHIHFNKYNRPGQDHITEMLVQQVEAGIKSKRNAIGDLNENFEDDDIEKEFNEILAEKSSVENTGNSDPQNANLENSTLEMLI